MTLLKSKKQRDGEINKLREEGKRRDGGSKRRRERGSGE